MEFKKHPERAIRHILSGPFIYMMIIPLITLDIFIEIYHRICFPLYGLKYIPRNEYIRIDRHKLSYLQWNEKINCTYCGYANGLLPYATAIAAETEKYWCGIKHAPGYKEPEHHKKFIKYNDEKEYKKILKK